LTVSDSAEITSDATLALVDAPRTAESDSAPGESDAITLLVVVLFAVSEREDSESDVVLKNTRSLVAVSLIAEMESELVLKRDCETLVALSEIPLTVSEAVAEKLVPDDPFGPYRNLL
jgi:hypothetical protein